MNLKKLLTIGACSAVLIGANSFSFLPNTAKAEIVTDDNEDDDFQSQPTNTTLLQFSKSQPYYVVKSGTALDEFLASNPIKDILLNKGKISYVDSYTTVSKSNDKNMYNPDSIMNYYEEFKPGKIYYIDFGITKVKNLNPHTIYSYRSDDGYYHASKSDDVNSIFLANDSSIVTFPIFVDRAPKNADKLPKEGLIFDSNGEGFNHDMSAVLGKLTIKKTKKVNNKHKSIYTSISTKKKIIKGRKGSKIATYNYKGQKKKSVIAGKKYSFNGKRTNIKVGKKYYVGYKIKGTSRYVLSKNLK